MDLDPYAVLAVSMDASDREIREAHRYAVRVLGEIAGALEPGVAAAKAAEIDRAWTMLRDPAGRAAIDANRRSTGAEDNGAAVRFSKSDGHPGKACSVCGAAPAMTMHFRVRRSRKVVESVSAMLCRTCGVATFRELTNRTLRQGFWRARTIVTTAAIVSGNWRERRRIDALRPPDHVPGLSLDPGRPVWMRSGIAAVAITISAVGLSVAQVVDLGGLLNSKTSAAVPWLHGESRHVGLRRPSQAVERPAGGLPSSDAPSLGGSVGVVR